MSLICVISMLEVLPKCILCVRSLSSQRSYHLNALPQKMIIAVGQSTWFLLVPLCLFVRDILTAARVLIYLKIRRGTQVAQGRGLQNLHSWVQIPPAPPNFPFHLGSVNR